MSLVDPLRSFNHLFTHIGLAGWRAVARQEEEQEVGVRDHNSASGRWRAWHGGEEASPHLILAAAGFPEVGDGGQLCVDGLGVEPSVVQVHDCFLCVLLATELHSHTEQRF